MRPSWIEQKQTSTGETISSMSVFSQLLFLVHFKIRSAIF